MRVVRWFVGSWLSRIYLGAVAVATVWAMLSIGAWDQPDANVAAVFPLLMTAPVSLPLLAAVEDWAINDGVFLGCVVVGALVNAAAINGVVALVRRIRARAGRYDA
ncbi:SCO4225 family membrane protein [Krasilnikovia sp. MM14-A1259]|uniref:SCO4225 family membrane protein n=1 Tax=Krasilnikovia sp. MM14-A1259 TaxID=3373539 RepID=UPI00380FD612